MDNLTFIVELTKALAWPMVVLISLFIIRPLIFKLIPMVQRLRYKDLELSFGEQVQEARAEVAVDLPGREDEAAVAPFQQRIIKLAEISPRAAVLESWSRLEAAILSAAKNRQDPSPRSPREAIKVLQQAEVIPSISAGVIDEMRFLRNQAAHAPEFALTSSSAIEYGNLAWKLTRELEEK